MARKYVKLLLQTALNSIPLEVGKTYAFEDDGTVERWEAAGIGEPSTEAVWNAQENLAKEQRAAARKAAEPPPEPGPGPGPEPEPEPARVITRGNAPGNK